MNSEIECPLLADFCLPPPAVMGSYGQFTANHGYETCWSDRMQTGGQLECSIPIGIPTRNQIRY